MNYLNFYDPETGAATNCVRIGELTKGRVVQATYFKENRKVPKSNAYGHIVGFDVNLTDETILCVEYKPGFPFERVHPANLILL